ncbi:glycosyltransferase family 10 domain-containing protein [Seonamhaeicola maritimus]|uniref:glycosyltransferase family 10 domain-containing protein n=1 Tax=Seonamhaeicola maritimus TaxID=2591822 RepID=UPI0024948957|nr:glycosyltransferase family 10 [Seonamhaeicola maritimus]
MKIKINFTDFWPDFDKTDNYFYNLLTQKYKVIIDEDPDLLFYSSFGKEYLKYKCKRIYFTGENFRPNFYLCDFAFSFDHNSQKNHFRLPLYSLYIERNKEFQNFWFQKNEEKLRHTWAKKDKFCCMVVSNAKAQERIKFFKNLSKFRQVDSGGAVLNNVGGRVKNKLDFIENYKFVMAFENSSFAGYTTEKILEPIAKNCIPIYWGNERIDLDFNPKRFINVHDYKSEEDLYNKLVEIESNPNLALEILKEPIFSENRIDFETEKNLVLQNMIAVFNSDKKPIAKTIWPFIYSLRKKYYHPIRDYLKNKN